MWGKSPDYQITFFSRCTEDFAVHSITPRSRKKQVRCYDSLHITNTPWCLWSNEAIEKIIHVYQRVASFFYFLFVHFFWNVVFYLSGFFKWILTGRRWTSTAPMTAPMIKSCIHMYTLSITFNIAVERGRYNVLVYYSVILN